MKSAKAWALFIALLGNGDISFGRVERYFLREAKVCLASSSQVNSFLFTALKKNELLSADRERKRPSVVR